MRADNTHISEDDPLPLEPGPHVKISIADQGLGIPEEHLQKIFDPFFTTKQKGSGLGLSTSFSILRRHNGALRVESRLGGGTEVLIYLPAIAGSPAEEEGKKGASFRGTGRILLIDDDEPLRRSIEKALERVGYEVVGAEDGAEAIRIYQEALASGRPIHAVITDLTIPGGLGGKEAINQLLELDPDARAIVSSGYANDPIMANHSAYGFCGVAPKPMGLQEFSEILSRHIGPAK